MAKNKTYGVLNVVAQPHPEGVYLELFRTAGRVQEGVQFFGDQYAAVSPPSDSREGVFQGRLAVWTEIDTTEPLIDKRSLKQTIFEDSDIELPEGIGFNSKVFYFAFRERDHTLFVELQNDEGQSISIDRARRAFSKVFRDVRIADVEEISVYTKTTTNAVERVLAIPKIRKIDIQLDIPNPDDLSEQEQEVLDEIKEMNAKRLKSEITKAPGENTLVLSPRWRVVAGLAKNNGYVEATGRDEDNHSITRSTREYPEIYQRQIEGDESSYLAARRAAERYGGD